MRLSALCVLVLLACGGPVDPNGGSGGGDNSGTGGGGGTIDTANHTVDTASLPCDVVASLSRNCASCHGSPATQGAHVTILSRNDLLAPMPDDMALTVGEASMYRMESMGQDVMPPPGGTPATPGDILSLSAYVGAGMLPGTCSGTTMPAQTTCPSGTSWTYGNSGSSQMNPGLACISCHLSQAPRERFAFAGTVFTDLHTKDLCKAGSMTGGKVELIGADGQVVSLGTNSSGNFYTFSTLQMPYTARVTLNGKVRSMTTPQVSGDCNSCHSEQGISNAPGRIIWPN
jgi:hypothetical protein